MTYGIQKPFSFIWAVVAALVLVACGGGGSGSDGSTSGEGTNIDFPGNIIGERIEFTVTEALTDTSVYVGFTVVYDFSTDGRVQGTNPVTGQVLEPVRYEYQANGNNATIYLYYEYSNGGEGYEEYKLYGDSSIMQGDYEYEAVVTAPNQYSAGKAKGEYRIVPPNNVGLYQAPNAEDISAEQEAIWQMLRRADNITAVATEGNRDLYVAIQQDGTLIADTSANPTQGQQGCTSNCDTIDTIFKAPPSGSFVAVEAAALRGMAINGSGELWVWAGESFDRPKIVSDLESPVHSFVEQSSHLSGGIVVTGPDRTLEYACITCNDEIETQAILDGLNISDVDKAIRLSWSNIYLYTDITNGLLALANGCTVNCDPPAIPTGLGRVIDFDTSDSFIVASFDTSNSFIVAIESTGQVTAWGWNGSSLPVPSEVGSSAVNVAVSGSHVAVVLENGTAVVWRYDMNTREAVDVRVPPAVDEATRVEHTDYDGHFIFL